MTYPERVGYSCKIVIGVITLVEQIIKSLYISCRCFSRNGSIQPLRFTIRVISLRFLETYKGSREILQFIVSDHNITYLPCDETATFDGFAI